MNIVRISRKAVGSLGSLGRTRPAVRPVTLTTRARPPPIGVRCAEAEAPLAEIDAGATMLRGVAHTEVPNGRLYRSDYPGDRRQVRRRSAGPALGGPGAAARGW